MPLLSAVAYGMMKKSINSRCGILPVAGSYWVSSLAMQSRPTGKSGQNRN